VNSLCVTVASLLLVAGCGSGSSRGPAAESTRPAREAGGVAQRPSTAPAEASDVSGVSSTTVGRTPSATSAAPVAAELGEVRRPRLGKYVYDVEGTRRSPFAQGEQPIPKGTTSTTELLSATDVPPGTEYTARTTSTEDNSATTTTKTRWEATREVLLHIRIETSAATLECAYTPPLETRHFPMKAEMFVKQSWSNEQCSGTAQITVIGQEDLTAAGRTWRAWKVKKHITLAFPGLDTTVDQIVWFSPDLGVDIKMDQTNEATFNQASIKSHTVSVVRSFP
jgi:hypothetical protein